MSILKTDLVLRLLDLLEQHLNLWRESRVLRKIGEAHLLGRTSARTPVNRKCLPETSDIHPSIHPSICLSIYMRVQTPK